MDTSQARCRLRSVLLLIGFIGSQLLMTRPAAPADRAEELEPVPPGFTSGFLVVQGIRLHYVAGGRGTPVLLIPGWLQSWYAWRNLMPALARNGHRVISVDPPGMGTSDRPLDGYDTGHVGTQLDLLMQKLGYSQYAVVGHDIGMWIGYAMAADHSQDVTKLALVEAIIPGLLRQEPVVFMSQKQSAFFWQFMFNQQPELPEMLIAGRQHAFMAYLFKHWAFHPERIAVDAYVSDYSSTDGIRAQMAYYRAFPQTIAENRSRAMRKLTMPVLALGGAHGVADFPRQMMAPVTTNLSSGVLPDCGHFAPDECPDAILVKLVPFLNEVHVAADAQSPAAVEGASGHVRW